MPAQELVHAHLVGKATSATSHVTRVTMATSANIAVHVLMAQLVIQWLATAHVQPDTKEPGDLLC